MKMAVKQYATKEQAEFANSKLIFPAFVGGFGSGKTGALILRCIKGMLKYPGLNRAYYLPTYDLVAQIGFPRFEEKLLELGIRYKLNEGKKTITIFHRGKKGKIIFRTLDKPERIIGYEVTDSDVDELDTLQTAKARDCWVKIVARNRQKKPDKAANTIGVGTTPEGFRFVYQRWEKEKSKSYGIIRASTRSNQRNLPDDYISLLEETYPPQLLEAYIDGLFVNLTSGAVYTSFDREKNNTKETIKHGEVLHIGMDFNVYKMSAVIHVIRGGLPLALGELHSIQDTPAMILSLKEKYPGHEAFIYPDASGGSAHSTGASFSDLSLLRDAFGSRNIRAKSKNPFVRNRVMAMNGMFLNAKGDRRCLVNVDECPEYTSGLEQQVYGKGGTPDKQNDNDHMPDAGGYFISFQYPVTGKPKIRVR